MSSGGLDSETREVGAVQSAQRQLTGGGAKGLVLWLARLTQLYFVLLMLLLVALERWGERNALLSVLLFAPPWLFLLPSAVLAPIALIVRPRLCLWHAAAVVLVLFGYMTFRGGSRVARTDEALSIVTHNVGQGNRQQFADFIRAENPDVILLQDARNRGTGYASAFPEHYVAGRGEFLLVSRHLIQQAALLEKPKWRGRAVAARYEIIVRGQRLAVYNVHMPTPRRQLSRVLTGRAVTDFFAEDDAPGSYQEWIAARIELARELAEAFAAERLPFIVGGDFNMPDHGHIYHLFASRMTDAFASAGRGWGLTFPGESRNPVALFGPWLRLDYLFAGRGWTPVSCDTEPGRKSQHLAVIARFQPAAPAAK